MDRRLNNDFSPNEAQKDTEALRLHSKVSNSSTLRADAGFKHLSSLCLKQAVAFLAGS